MFIWSESGHQTKRDLSLPLPIASGGGGGTAELSDVDGRKNCLGRRIWKVLFAYLDILGWPRRPRLQQQQEILLKIGKITNNIIFPPANSL